MLRLRTHDNWEKLVTATLRKEQLWQLCHAPSPSISSFASSSSSSDLTCLSPPFPDELPNYTLVANNYSEILYVNNKLLDAKQLSLLKTCPNPPTNIKPGPNYFWYDKRAGFWGKIGHKPSQIISVNLDIGGRLDRCASNGNTLVYINGREITKVELGLLKFSGVRCYRHMNIWMYEDGSYLVQGLACSRANIWSKAGMRLLCSVLSLSFPYKTPDASEDLPEASYVADVKKLVLIGRSGSGKSTIFKQAKFLYKDIPFTEDELDNIKMLIRGNIYRYIRLLLQAHQDFEQAQSNEMTVYQFYDELRLTGCTDPNDEKEICWSYPRLKAFSIWHLNILVSGTLDLSSTSIIQHYTPLLEELWKDKAIQKTLERTIESRMLPSVASYFLTRAVDIFSPNYTPSRLDILHAEDCTSSTSYLEFSLIEPHDDVICSVNQQAFMPRYQLIRSPAIGFEYNLEELEMFEDVGIVIFCVPLSDYDQYVVNEEGYTNMMMLDRKLFENVVTSPTFDHTGVLLLLTKYDLFEEKIKQIPLNQCDFLANFNPVENRAGAVVDNLAEIAFHYISVQFKRLYTAATGRKLYVSKVNGLDEESVNGVMNYAREMLKWEDEIKRSRYVEQESRRKFLICL